MHFLELGGLGAEVLFHLRGECGERIECEVPGGAEVRLGEDVLKRIATLELVEVQTDLKVGLTKGDAVFSEKLARNGQELAVSRYSVAPMVDAYVDLYRQVLAKR